MAIVDEEQLKQNLARNLKHLRISRKPYLSQQMLAKKLEVTQKSISRYETGKCLPPPYLIVALAECFGTTTDALLGDKLPGKKGTQINENLTCCDQTIDCRRKKQAYG